MDYLRYYFGTVLVCIAIGGFIQGGHWVWVGVGLLIPITILDVLAKPDLKMRKINHPFIVNIPLYLHLFFMIGLYASFVHWVNTTVQATGSIPIIDMVGAVFSLGLLGAMPNVPVTHELLHRRDFGRHIATLLATFFLDPTRDVAHIHNHHINLATPEDSDTARRGETIYTYMFRASFGSYKDFIHAEREKSKKTNKSIWSPSGRLVRAIVQVLILIGAVTWFGGIYAMGICIFGLMLAKLFAEGFNYFQHNGLVRVEGKPYESRHIWNHLSYIIRPLAYEISNHNDHHLDSYIPFYELRPTPEGPQGPSMFLSFNAALIPPIWFKFFAQPKLKEWDLTRATPEEKVLAREANKAAGWPDWIGEPTTDEAASA